MSTSRNGYVRTTSTDVYKGYAQEPDNIEYDYQYKDKSGLYLAVGITAVLIVIAVLWFVVTFNVHIVL